VVVEVVCGCSNDDNEATEVLNESGDPEEAENHVHSRVEVLLFLEVNIFLLWNDTGGFDLVERHDGSEAKEPDNNDNDIEQEVQVWNKDYSLVVRNLVG
jgi:hypothetical protein